MSNIVPANEAPEENGPSRGFSKTWIVLGLLVLAHAAFGAYFNPVGDTPNEIGEIRIFFLLGTLLAQPILFAIWASFAHQRFYHRFLWALLLCTLVSFAEDLGTLRHGNHRDLGMLMVMDTTLFLTATLILSVFRHFSRWQIKQPGGEDAPSVYEGYHFGIKHLLILTTIAALGCGLFRTLHIINPDMTLSPSVGRFVGAICLFLALLFPVVVIPWLTLAYRRRLASQIFITVIMVGLLDLVAYFIMVTMEPPRTGISLYELIKPCLFIQLGSCISATVTTLVIRFCGFRMIRKPKTQKPT
ncbi:MAG: hypothetical protein ACLP9L_33940 [Thermoguttaceae bacterium]